jgi:hypothetical protein
MATGRESIPMRRVAQEMLRVVQDAGSTRQMVQAFLRQPDESFTGRKQIMTTFPKIFLPSAAPGFWRSFFLAGQNLPGRCIAYPLTASGRSPTLYRRRNFRRRICQTT